jgi:hypothetical protein
VAKDTFDLSIEAKLEVVRMGHRGSGDWIYVLPETVRTLMDIYLISI